MYENITCEEIIQYPQYIYSRLADQSNREIYMVMYLILSVCDSGTFSCCKKYSQSAHSDWFY